MTLRENSMTKVRLTDLEAWDIVDPEDAWVFDKLLLSKRLGYPCGPKGTEVPKKDKYVVRPCVNLLGMGRSAEILTLEGNTEYLIDDGFFWQKKFNGRHLSFDYVDGIQVLCVEGHKVNKNNLRTWARWEKTKHRFKLPPFLLMLAVKYRYLNIETIGGKIIEVHLRLNPDFQNHDSDYVIPVYDNEIIMPSEEQEFIMNLDEERLGFYIQRSKKHEGIF